MLIKVRTAEDSKDLEAVWRLTHDMYVAMGYTQPRPDGRLIHYPHLDQVPQTTVWLAENEAGRLLGTLSYTDDGPAGLHVDDDFRDLVDAIRAECRAGRKRLGASWRIATHSECRNSLDVVMALITTYVEFIASREVAVTLYTFNPRHASFYRKMMDFELLGQPREGHAVSGAPAILMRGDLPRIIARWQQVLARRDSARRHAVLLAGAEG